MRKQDIEVGVEYAASYTKDYLEYSHAVHRIVVVENETYVERSWNDYESRQAAKKDPEWVKAHLALCLCEAYPKDTTPRELSDAKAALREADREARARWLAEDERRKFVQSKNRSYYGGELGVLCRYVNNDGTPGKLTTVPRRELKSRWDVYVQQRGELAKRRAEQRRLAQERSEKLDAQRNALKPKVEAAFEGTGVNAPFISGWGDSVTLSYAQLEVLLARKEETD